MWLYSFFNLGSRLGWVVKATPRPLHSQVKASLFIVEGAKWNAGPVWTDTVKRKSVSFEGVHSLDRPVQSEPSPLRCLGLVHERGS